MAYLSKNRINKSKSSSEEIGLIVQPPPRSRPNNYLRQSTPIKNMPSDPFMDPYSDLHATAVWLKQNGYPVLKEKTTIHDKSAISDMAVVISHSGNNELRYAANARAISRILNASPKPKLFIFVEYVFEGDTPHYATLKGFDKIIIKSIPKESAGLFQKEAMWNTGGRYAFEQEGITKCLFLDADCAYEDNSWAYYCDKALDTAEFVQPYAGVYYSEQPDLNNAYGDRNIFVSTAYAIIHGIGKGTPGGAFACTKNFFCNVLQGSWPYSGLGSGDAIFWIFLKGKEVMNYCPTHYDFCLADEKGRHPECKINYTNQILIHYYHGPIANRMYRTRDYILKKTAITPASEIVEKDSVLTWANTLEGNILRESNIVLQNLTNKAIERGELLTLRELKSEVQPILDKYYGSITTTLVSNLNIVTCYRKHKDNLERLTQFKEQLKRYCLTPFKFVVVSDETDLSLADEVISPDELKFTSGIWDRMHVFKKKWNSYDNILFMDSSCSILHEFNMCISPELYFHMARPYGHINTYGRLTWDTALMYFRGSDVLTNMYNKFLTDMKVGGIQDAEFQCIDPSEYISGYLRNCSGIKVRNIIAQLDYMYRKDHMDTEGIDIIINP